MVGCVPTWETRSGVHHVGGTFLPRHPRSIGVLIGKLASTCTVSTPGIDHPCADNASLTLSLSIARCTARSRWVRRRPVLGLPNSLPSHGSRCANGPSTCKDPCRKADESAFHLTPIPTIQTSTFGIRIDQTDIRVAG